MAGSDTAAAKEHSIVTFRLQGQSRVFRCPADRLDELLDAADRRFGCTDVDPVRFAAALKLSKGQK